MSIWRHRVLAAICFSPLLASAPVPAPTSPATQQLLRSALQLDAMSNDKDVAGLIRAVAAYCAEVSDVYPRNTPAEDQWLASEIKGGGNRLPRVFQSAELGRRVAANFTGECKSYVSAYARPSQRRVALVGLAYTFTRFERDAAFYAPKNGVDPKRFAFGSLSAAVEAILLAALKAG